MNSQNVKTKTNKTANVKMIALTAMIAIFCAAPFVRFFMYSLLPSVVMVQGTFVLNNR